MAFVKRNIYFVQELSSPCLEEYKPFSDNKFLWVEMKYYEQKFHYEVLMSRNREFKSVVFIEDD